MFSAMALDSSLNACSTENKGQTLVGNIAGPGSFLPLQAKATIKPGTSVVAEPQAPLGQYQESPP